MKVEFEKMILSPHRALAFKAFVESELYHSCPDFKEAKETLLKLGEFPLEKMTDYASLDFYLGTMND